MYRIGEFSMLNQVTIKTLRYYDSIGLFKPSVVDKFTGYRYYSEEQQEEFDKIMEYKDLGFSLEEIKKINDQPDANTQVIRNKIDELTKEVNENRRKIGILSNKLRGKIMKVEFRPYIEKYKIGKKVTLKSRNFEEDLKNIKEEIEKSNLNITLERPVLCNFELGYEIENIDAFVGYEIKEDNFIDDFSEKLGNLEIMTVGKSEKMLIGKGNVMNLNDIYSDMIKYAKKNNIQIRGFYTEVYDKEEIEIYVEAYDLNEQNECYVHHLDKYEIIAEIDKTLIGEYKIREILPNIKWMFNVNKQKSLLDTKFNKLELKEDGTTNFENIKWNKKELIVMIDNTNIPEPIYKYEINNELYIAILMNDNYEYHKSQRPMFYIYKKIK